MKNENNSKLLKGILESQEKKYNMKIKEMKAKNNNLINDNEYLKKQLNQVFLIILIKLNSKS